MTDAHPSAIDRDLEYKEGSNLEIAELHPPVSLRMDWPHGQSPISRLSPELLIEVIRLCMIVNPIVIGQKTTEGTTKSFKTPRHALIQMTHVCRFWRDVALSYPMFWDKVFITQPDCVREWLIRSKQAPFKVISKSDDASISDAEEVESYRLVLEHISRVRDIMWSTEPHLIQLLSSSGWVDLSAPLLQSVGVYPGRASPIELQKRILEAERFVPRNAPCLQKLNLQLHEGVIWRNAQLAPTLKHLHISGIFTSESLDAMFSAVATLPELEFLDFHVGPDQGFQIRPQQKYILPPCLKDFTLQNREDYPIRVAEFAPLLDYFSFPQITSISVVLDILDQELSLPLRALAASIAMALHGGDRPTQPILSLILRFLSSDEFSLEAWSSYQRLYPYFETSEERGSPRLGMDLDWARIEDDEAVAEGVKTLLEHFLPSLPLLDVQTLALTFAFDNEGMISLISGLTMRWCFGGMVSLKTLYIALLSGKELLCLLAGEEDESLLRGAPIVFPSLVTLHLDNVDFVDTELSLLADWLRERQAAGVGITALAFTACDGVRTEDVELFRTLVAEVQCEAAPWQVSSSSSTSSKSSSPSSSP